MCKTAHFLVVLSFYGGSCLAHEAGSTATSNTFLSSISQVISGLFRGDGSPNEMNVIPESNTTQNTNPMGSLPNTEFSRKEPTNTMNQSEIQPVVQEVDIMPHRATYEISLLDSSGSDDISDVKGWMTIEVRDGPDGWTTLQKSGLIIYKAEEGAEQFTTTLATWESKDGLKYIFNARTLRDGEEQEEIKGDAVMATKEGAGVVTYQLPAASTVSLPAGTVFPAQLLVQTLRAAKAGQTVISNLVFDGTSETHEPVDVNTVIGKGVPPKLKLSDTTLFQANKVWPMRMAVYPVGSLDPDSEYVIKQKVLDSGVIEFMTQDYGTFSVGIQLTKVEIFS